MKLTPDFPQKKLICIEIVGIIYPPLAYSFIRLQKVFGLNNGLNGQITMVWQLCCHTFSILTPRRLRSDVLSHAGVQEMGC